MLERSREDDSPEIAAAYEKARAMFTTEQLTELFLHEEPMIPFEDVLKELQLLTDEETTGGAST